MGEEGASVCVWDIGGMDGVWLGELIVRLDDAREMDGCVVARPFFFFHLGLGTILALAVCFHAFWSRAWPFLFRQGMYVFLSVHCADGVMAMGDEGEWWVCL